MYTHNYIYNLISDKSIANTENIYNIRSTKSGKVKDVLAHGVPMSLVKILSWIIFDLQHFILCLQMEILFMNILIFLIYLSLQSCDEILYLLRVLVIAVSLSI